MRSETFAEMFMNEFESFLEQAKDQLQDRMRLKVIRSANRVAALLEMMIRDPASADRIKLALRMEKGIIETALARTAVDAREALHAAATRAAIGLVTVALA